MQAMKGCFTLIVFLFLLGAGCSIFFGTDSDDEVETQGDIQTKNEDTEELRGFNWNEEVSKIASTEKENGEKYQEVINLAAEYKITTEEVEKFEKEIIEEFVSKRYLQSLDDHEYTLQLIFKSFALDRYYQRTNYQKLDMSNFTFDFFQNLKYTYRGYETVDSESVHSNEHQMEKSLKKMQ